MKNSSFIPYISILQPVDGSPSEMMRQSQALEEECRTRAEKILLEAREKAARIEEEAYQRGFQSGVSQGEATGRRLYEEKVGQMEHLLGNIAEQKKSLAGKHEQALLQLVKAMVERLVNHEVSVNPLVIQTCLKKAMAHIIENTAVRVRLHPDDFGRIKETGIEDPLFLNGNGQMQLLEDPAISRGGCVLESDFGMVDASLDSFRSRLFEAVDQAFYCALTEAPADI